MNRINMSATAEYWMRILGALALIKMATSLVQSAEKLISTNMKARGIPVNEPITIVEYEETWTQPDNGDQPAYQPPMLRDNPLDDPADPGIVAMRQEMDDETTD